MASRQDGTNPRSLGTNPRATPAGTPGTASQPPPIAKAEQEVARQIPIDEAPEEQRFMKSAAEALALAHHDDDCAFRKGKECGCRENLGAIERKELPVLEEKKMEWEVTTYRKANASEIAKARFKPVAVMVAESCTLVRVDGGRKVEVMVADPLSPRAPPIRVTRSEPPRWICLDCAATQRGNDLDHHCDDAVRSRAHKPLGLEKTIPLEVRFGGGYRLTIWRDRAGDYHLGEEVVKDGKVVEERHLYGPESYNVIEGAILDAAVNKLTP